MVMKARRNGIVLNKIGVMQLGQKTFPEAGFKPDKLAQSTKLPLLQLLER